MRLLRKHVLPVIPGFLLLLVISTTNAILMPRFLRLLNSNLLLAAPVAFLALGETILLITGEVDLSVGSALILVNAVTVSAYTDYGIDGVMFFLVPLFTGLFIGTVQGVLVAFGRVNSFLATVGTSFAWAGMALLILREPRGAVPIWFKRIFSAGIAGIPAGVLALILAICIWIMFVASRFATNFYAVGSDPRSGFILGLRVDRVKFYAFLFNGLLVGLGGLVMTGIIGSGDPRLGTLSTILAILAALIGGARFAGGTGNGVGAIFGAIGLQFARNLVAWLGVAYYLIDLVYGSVLIFLIAIITMIRRKVENEKMQF